MTDLRRLAWIGIFITVAAVSGWLLDTDRARAEGLTAYQNHFFRQGAFDCSGNACGEDGDRFGEVLAAGDFNGDGHDDLAIGMPSEDDSALDTDSGALQVKLSSAAGFLQVLTGFYYSDSVDDSDRRFGAMLAVGDFNDDGNDDLVVGATGNALFGPSLKRYTGLSHLQGLTPFSNIGPHPVTYTASDLKQIAAGDFNCDGDDDLVALSSTSAIVFEGTGSGINNTPVHTVALSDVPSSVSVGTFNGDSCDDLAIGFHLADVNGIPDSGRAEVRFGHATTPLGTRENWHQDSTDIVGGAETSDHFGFSVAAGDLNGDGNGDLAVGVPKEDALQVDQGAFQRIYGDGSGLTAVNNQLHNAGPNTEASAEFGIAVATGDFDEADAADELAGGAWLQNPVGVNNAGAVYVAFSDATINFWHQDVPDVLDQLNAGDGFGRALAVGDFDGDGAEDLAIGVPFEGSNDSGGVNVLYGTPGAGASGDTDGDGCPDLKEQQTALGSQISGGLRDWTNPYDYMNPTDDGTNRIDDVLAVVGQYFDDDTDANPGLPPYAPGYDPDTDRTDNPASSEDWDLLVGNGQQRIDDILAVIKQYFHDCS